MRTALLVVVAVATVACRSAQPARPPIEVARAYLEAARDLDTRAMSALVTADATVFEVGDEGSFGQYRVAHLQPELDALTSVAMTLGDPALRESDDGSLSVVRWPIRRFAMQRSDGSVREASGAATFVLSPHDGQWRIEHVHWSLRTDLPSP